MGIRDGDEIEDASIATEETMISQTKPIYKFTNCRIQTKFSSLHRLNSI